MHKHKNSNNKTILVTGGAGFIGAAFVRLLLSGKIDSGSIGKIIILDSLTYAGNLNRLENFRNHPAVQIVVDDICNKDVVDTLVIQSDEVIHFAAESHVDRSIESGQSFMQTNIIGTSILLETVLNHRKKIVLVSTDEVYGSISSGTADENFKLNPSSPYSSSKAAADLIGLSYFKTYGLDVKITRCANNYGKYQNSEKFIPTVIENLLNNKKIPIYGDGQYYREWIHTDDHCSAISTVASKGSPGNIYNIAGDNGVSNLDIVNLIAVKLNKPNNFVTYVKDRQGHDRRYAVNDAKIRTQLGWSRKLNLVESLDEIIDSTFKIQ